MKFRKLRIAWSMAWGLACVLLIVLWVRSYKYVDTLDWHTKGQREIWFASMSGVVNFQGYNFQVLPGSYQGSPGFVYEVRTPTAPTKTYRWSFGTGHFEVQIPQWLAVVSLAILAAAPII